MKAWKVYRNGSQTLTERIGAALEHYAVHNAGALPAGIRVNPKDVEAARAIVKALDLETLAVIGNGGALAGEVWLEVAGKWGSGDLGNSRLSTGSQPAGQFVEPMCNGEKIESLPDVV
jgi:hypothetical protein